MNWIRGRPGGAGVWHAYLTHGTAMGEARRSEPHDLASRLVADHVEVVLQGRVLGALEVHQLRLFIDPDLQAMGASVNSRVWLHFLP